MEGSKLDLNDPMVKELITLLKAAYHQLEHSQLKHDIQDLLNSLDKKENL